jgi:hypothetical protein
LFSIDDLNAVSIDELLPRPSNRLEQALDVGSAAGQ